MYISFNFFHIKSLMENSFFYVILDTPLFYVSIFIDQASPLFVFFLVAPLSSDTTTSCVTMLDKKDTFYFYRTLMLINITVTLHNLLTLVEACGILRTVAL